jgi:S-formylglutathione hydrolase
MESDMKKNFLLKVILVLFFFCWWMSGCSPQKKDESQLLSLTIPAPSLQTNLLGLAAARSILVYLPPSYQSSGQRYPVIYFLPGYGDPISLYQKGTFQGFYLQASLDALIQDNKIQEMIFVMVDGQCDSLGSFYQNSPVTGEWQEMVIDDLVGYMDANYRTLPQASSRGIAGHSMGGFGAIDLGMRHPDIFSSIYALSPGLFDPDGLGECQMFSAPAVSGQLLDLIDELKAVSRSDAHALLLAKLPGMSFDVQFSIAYGMAFAPAADFNAPYIRYPYQRENGSAVRDQEIWQGWENGFGGLADKVRTYRENLLKIKALALDFGTQDEFQWIPKGGRYFSQLLKDAGIPHQALEFAGRHSNRLRERIEQFMLPFFSDHLSF